MSERVGPGDRMSTRDKAPRHRAELRISSSWRAVAAERPRFGYRRCTCIADWDTFGGMRSQLPSLPLPFSAELAGTKLEKQQRSLLDWPARGQPTHALKPKL